MCPNAGSGDVSAHERHSSTTGQREHTRRRDSIAPGDAPGSMSIDVFVRAHSARIAQSPGNAGTSRR